MLKVVTLKLALYTPPPDDGRLPSYGVGYGAEKQKVHQFLGVLIPDGMPSHQKRHVSWTERLYISTVVQPLNRQVDASLSSTRRRSTEVMGRVAGVVEEAVQIVQNSAKRAKRTVVGVARAILSRSEAGVMRAATVIETPLTATVILAFPSSSG